MATFKIMRAELFNDINKLKQALDQIPAGQDIIVAFEEKTKAGLKPDIQSDIRDEHNGFSLRSKLNGDAYYVANSVASNIAGADDKGKHGGNAVSADKGKPGGGNSLNNLL